MLEAALSNAGSPFNLFIHQISIGLLKSENSFAFPEIHKKLYGRFTQQVCMQPKAHPFGYYENIVELIVRRKVF